MALASKLPLHWSENARVQRTLDHPERMADMAEAQNPHGVIFETPFLICADAKANSPNGRIRSGYITKGQQGVMNQQENQINREIRQDAAKEGPLHHGTL